MQPSPKTFVAGFACIVILGALPERAHAQFGVPGIPGIGGGGGINFRPSVSDSLNQNRGGPNQAIGMFERARQESVNRAPKYGSMNSAGSLSPRSANLAGDSTPARRVLERRQESGTLRSGGSRVRIPPGLREVKNARRAALTNPNSGLESDRSRADARNTSP